VTFMNVSLSDPVVRGALTTTGSLGVVGARFILDGGPSQSRFSLVEHPIVARGMAAPLHMHTREDEYSFILEGRWGFWQGGNVVFAEPGDCHARVSLGLVCKAPSASTMRASPSLVGGAGGQAADPIRLAGFELLHEAKYERQDRGPYAAAADADLSNGVLTLPVLRRRGFAASPWQLLEPGAVNEPAVSRGGRQFAVDELEYCLGHLDHPRRKCGGATARLFAAGTAGPPHESGVARSH
jgi:hypothetical protein